MRELFIDCSSGVSGDMLSAALLELCDNPQKIIDRLNSFGIPGVEYSAEKTQKHSVTGTHLTVKYKGCEEEAGHQDGKHCHNSLFEINSLVDGLDMPDSVKRDVKAVYSIIAEAEAHVHGCEIEHIHFHELGSMDAVADISATCFIVSILKAERITASPVCTGYGEVKCAHGILPVPAPATANILKGIPSFAGNMEGELCTPTGAALIKFLACDFAQMPVISADKIGYGLGKKDFPRLSVVRTSFGESEENIIELSCNVDDMSPEAIGFAIDELLCHGAPDAYYESIGMKKNRPGVLLTCLCRESQRDEMVNLIFKHTTTLGIRETLCRRYVLKRAEKTVSTQYGPVRIKLSEGYGVSRKKAEYDDLARIAKENGISIFEVKDLAENMKIEER